MTSYYPIMLKIEGKPCKVIGGGRVAERKINTLLKHGADVTLISPKITEGLSILAEKGKIKYINRNYQKGDLKGAYLAFALTDNKDINAECEKEARENNIFINIADSEDLSDFIIPASINRGSLNISISTGGKSPMLAGKIKKELEEIYGEQYEYILNTLWELRKKILKEIPSIEERREIFKKLVYDIDLHSSTKEIQDSMYKIYRDHKRH
ncbi:MAG: bifunctional precorrin-2 dehydrogenase/sirohydrochlorin ferrochelatase [Clostridiales bacterium]|nr:bifunctional precorrin-2 dehydrogenase/sirohydrochlorin ferrochelatase [Clostridiales bacterium]